MLGQARADAARERDELRAATEARIRAAEAELERREREHARRAGPHRGRRAGARHGAGRSTGRPAGPRRARRARARPGARRPGSRDARQWCTATAAPTRRGAGAVTPVRAADRGRCPADWPQIPAAIRFGRGRWPMRMHRRMRDRARETLRSPAQAGTPGHRVTGRADHPSTCSASDSPSSTSSPPRTGPRSSTSSTTCSPTTAPAPPSPATPADLSRARDPQCSEPGQLRAVSRPAISLYFDQSNGAAGSLRRSASSRSPRIRSMFSTRPSSSVSQAPS